MAHGRRRRTIDQYDQLNAMPSVIARKYPVESYFFEPYRPIRSISLLPTEDLRAYHPLATARPVRVVSGAAVQPLRVAAPASTARRAGLYAPPGLSPHLKFAVPSKTIVCIRRARRREVLFAKRKFGGSGGRRRRNFWSDIRCSNS